MEDQLATYLSLFLSYFDNINPVYNGRSAVWSSLPEKAVPTVVLEKVAADQALYLRVANSLESLPVSIDSRMPLSRTVSISDGDNIMVSDIESEPLDNSIRQCTDRINQQIDFKSDSSGGKWMARHE